MSSLSPEVLSNNTNPFSVLISVYWKEKPEYLEQAFDSLVNQVKQPDEIVLVEDGPIGNDLKDVISRYKTLLPIKSVVLEVNQGLATALNTGLKACNYDLVARMDTDDISLKNRFEVQIAFMNDNPDVAACSAYLEERCDQMEQIRFVKKLPLTHKEIVQFCRFRSPLSHPVSMFRKKAVESVGGYPKIYPEDYPLWCKLIHADYILANIPQVLLHMRAGDGMISRRGKAFLPGYIQSYNLLFELGMISRSRLFFNILVQSVVRYLPSFVLKLVYRYGR